MTSFDDILSMELLITNVFIREERSYMDSIALEFGNSVFAVFTINTEDTGLFYETKKNICKENYTEASSIFPFMKKVLGTFVIFSWLLTDNKGVLDAFQLDLNLKGIDIIQVKKTASGLQVFQVVHLKRIS